MPPPPRLLLAPLHWGLGHAARCLPIAAALEAAAAERGLALHLHWASDGNALALLHRERPGDAHHELPAYGVRYPTRHPLLNVALSGPQMLRAIGRETQTVRGLHERHAFDLVISDHRYGCRVPGVRSLFVTHQVHLPVAGLAGRVAQAMQEAWVGGFDEVLIPDYATAPRLAGEMSAPPRRMPATYLGPVSRFARAPPPAQTPQMAQTTRAGDADVAPRDPALVCLLSGPEPARSRLEALLYERLDRPATLIRGTTQPRTSAPPAHFTVHDLLTAGELRAVLAQAPRLITRPGYTTVMDLAILGRRAVFVPTPGQPEQARLGRSLAAGGHGVTVTQEELKVPGALARALGQLAGLEAASAERSARGSLRDDAAERGRSLLGDWARREVTRLTLPSVNTL